jgi:hypothetical protein
MLKIFTKHLKNQNETYLQHFCSAWKIIFCLKKIEMRCAVHAVFPFLYTDALSSQLDCLYKLTNRAKPDIDEELYETYGGD